MESLSKELSASSYATILERLNTTNILPKMIKKMSQVYTSLNVVRNVVNPNEIDSELSSFYIKETRLNQKLNIANKMFNLFGYCALELNAIDSHPVLRVLNPTQFTVFNNDPNNSLSVSYFIKYAGTIQIQVEKTNSDGIKSQSPETEIRNVNRYWIYSKEEIAKVDSTGNIYEQYPNEAGVIPFVYINSSDNMLVPYPNSDLLDMVMLPAKLFSDMNYATKFLSHSITYGIDVDTQNLSLAPDSFWNIKSSEGEGKTPQIGTIAPTVDTDKTITLIKESLALFFDSIGIKSQATGNISNNSDASGIAKMIDTADVSELTFEQSEIFKNAEKELWKLIAKLHPLFVANSELKVNKSFSPDFEMEVNFDAYSAVVDTKQEIEEVILLLDKQLITKTQALQRIYPDKTPDEIAQLELELTPQPKKQLTETLPVAISEDKADDTMPENNEEIKYEEFYGKL
jgi:hypothetical protein